jgi:hypothetical protein
MYRIEKDKPLLDKYGRIFIDGGIGIHEMGIVCIM